MQRVDARNGFTLIEVLVAIAIIGIAMLGSAGLQTDALQGSRDAADRGQAAALASAMADRIRANPAAYDGSDDEYDKATPGDDVTDCHTSSCDATELAMYDVSEWQSAVGNRLGGAETIICRDGSSGSTDDGTPSNPSCNGDSSDPYAIKIWWADSDGDSRARYVLSLQPS